MQLEKHESASRVPWEMARQSRFLASLSPDDLGAICQVLSVVSLRAGQEIDSRGENRRVLFPTSSAACLVAGDTEGAYSQVAMVGKEGVLGLDFLTGVPLPGRWIVHTPGCALSAPAAELAELLRSRASLLRPFLACTQSLMAQMAQSALCNRHHTVEQQLATWLLAALDRTETHELQVTQQFIASMLGVRREAVSMAAGRLAAAGAIVVARNAIRLRDPSTLHSRSCKCHQVGHRQLAPAAAPRPALQPVRPAPSWGFAWQPT